MSRWKTLQVTRSDRDVVEIVLDTPKSEVNILTGQVVTEIHQVLEELDDADVSALVFSSAKPRSFINGAQLMLASAVQSPESIFSLTEVLRRTYRAVAEFDAPTIAAVRGSCYGCGVELSLCCDYRLARDGADTTFYMTEITDYLNGPAFGSTQRLPRMLGLEHAVGFLMWGHRLWGARAVEVGLVERVLSPARFREQVDAFVDDVLDGRVEAPQQVRESAETVEQVRRQTAAEIARLPEAYQPLHEQCLGLLVHSATKQGPLEADDFKRELRVAGQTLVEPQAEAARSFLYLRQLAERVWVRNLPAGRSLQLSGEAGDQAAQRLLDELARRRVPGVLIGEADTSKPAADLALRLDGHADRGVSVRKEGVAPDELAPMALRRTASHIDLASWERRVPSTGTRPLIEIALTKDVPAGDHLPQVAALFEYLDAAGFSVVITQPAEGFSTDRFLAAFLAPLVAFVADGGDPDEVHASLARFGFVPSALDGLATNVDQDALLGQLDGLGQLGRRLPAKLEPKAAESLDRLLKAEPGAATASSTTATHPALTDAVVLSLLHATREALACSELRHCTLADVICREMLGFPLGHASLCEYASVERVAAMLDDANTLASWLPESVIDDAGAFVDDGRNFYL